MTQDTRKDRRVKIVSLNVRYKSATVDEFIENHAHDVSRGGIYIKTGSPFPPGTLLKFEVRLASDQAVITGVGRVVWKRETASGTGERPAGMGVKFIKVDDSSKTVIDKLVNTRADAGKTYEAEVEGPGKTSERPPAVAPAPRPGAPGPSKTPPAPAASPRPNKATMVGLGAVQAPSTPAPRPVASATPPRVSAAADMFPKQSPSNRPDEAKAEPTVMKQAAELLEEALREAGGSMAEVGTNPLFGSTPEPAVAKTPPPAAGMPARSAADEVTIHKFLSPVPEAPPPEPEDPRDEAAKARAMVAGMSPGATTRHAPSDPPRADRDTANATGPQRVSRPPSLRPQPRTSNRPAASPPAPDKKAGNTGGLIFVGLLAAVAVAAFVFRAQIFGGQAPPEPPPPATATAATAPPPSATAAASAATAPSASAPESASAAPAASTAPSTTSSAASASTPAKPAPAPKPGPGAPGPAPAKAAAPAATSTAAAAPTVEAPVATAAPVATSTATAAPAPAATAAPAATTAAPVPKPAPAKPKPAAKPSDDNPY
jgi:uncharacterized protein (TIGR02266 family)